MKYISEAYEEVALKQKGSRIAAYVKHLRMFGVVGFDRWEDFLKVKSFLANDLSYPIMYNEKKNIIWVREVGESLDRLFGGLTKFS